jgi:hypothetical protein
MLLLLLLLGRIPGDFNQKFKIDSISAGTHWTENEKKRSFIFFSLFDLKLGHSADNFLFSVGNQIFLFNNFNTATHGTH